MRMAARILAAGLMLGAASPAAAQIVGRNSYGPVGSANPFLPDSATPLPSIGRDLRGVRDRIGRLEEAGTISRREARAMRREAYWIGTLAERYGQDGLSRAERRELETRTQALRATVNR